MLLIGMALALTVAAEAVAPASPVAAPKPLKVVDAAPKKPPAKPGIEIGAVKVTGALPPKKAAEILRHRRAELERCFTPDALALTVSKATFEIVLAATGGVEAVTTRSRTFTAVHSDCFAAHLRSTVFPSPGRGRGATVTVTLTHRKPAPAASAKSDAASKAMLEALAGVGPGISAIGAKAPDPLATRVTAGSAVSVDPARPTVTIGPITFDDAGDGTLDEVKVRGVILRYVPGIFRCYERALTTDPALAGMLTVRLVVEPSGAPSAVEKSGSTLTAAGGVETCAIERLTAARFPSFAAGETVIATVKLLFRPPAD